MIFSRTRWLGALAGLRHSRSRGSSRSLDTGSSSTTRSICCCCSMKSSSSSTSKTSTISRSAPTRTLALVTAEVQLHSCLHCSASHAGSCSWATCWARAPLVMWCRACGVGVQLPSRWWARAAGSLHQHLCGKPRCCGACSRCRGCASQLCGHTAMWAARTATSWQ